MPARVEYNGVFNGTVTTTVIEEPEPGRVAEIRSLRVANIDTAAVTLTLYYDDNGTTRTIQKVTIEADETCYFNEIYLDRDNRKLTGVLAAEPATSNPQFTAAVMIHNPDVS